MHDVGGEAVSEYTPTEARICIDFCNAAIKRPAPDGSLMSMEEADAAFSRWLAAHDAEVRAGVVAEEPEWEYGTRCPMPECTEPHSLDEGDAPPGPAESLWRRTRERTIPAGEWEQVS